jgi:hypothetical protein
MGDDPVNDNSDVKVRIRVTDPWDSTEVIVGILSKDIFVDDLKSALIFSEKGEWIVLLPRHKGQDLLTELLDKKESVANIAWLSDKFESTMKQITGEFITNYGSGDVIRLE